MKPLALAALAASLAVLVATPALALFPIDSNTPNPLPSGFEAVDGCPDGAGGVFIVAGAFGANDQVRVYRVGQTGAPAPGWGASGIVLADTSGARSGEQIEPDGSGGVFVAWHDLRNPAQQQDIFVQHVTGAGAIAAGWPARGIRIGTTFDESFPSLHGDGVGGVVVAYSLLWSYPDYDLYAARLSATGVQQWYQAVESTGANESSPRLVLDHADGIVGLAYSYKSPAGGSTYEVKLTLVYLSSGLLYTRRDVCLAAGDQYLYGVAEGTGDNYYIYWRDGRTANYTAYAALYTRTSQAFSGWPFGDGLPIADGGTYQSDVDCVVDAQNNLWAAISDWRYSGEDVVVQRFSTFGLPVLGWPAAGLTVCSAVNDQSVVGLDLDGAQNLVVLWTDRRVGSPTQNDMFVQRLRPDASIAPGYVYNGTPVATEPGAQQSLGFVVGDPAGGGYLGFSGGGAQLKHIDRFGALGDVAPVLTSVKDVKGDQGGQVRLQWSASPYDAEPIASIASYYVWRATPATLAQQAVARGARWGADPVALTAGAPAPGERWFMADPFGATAYAWEYLDSQPASLMPSYSYVAETAFDSTAGHNPRTAFMVQARSKTTGLFWSSPADSGYSVDDLAPAAPAPFSGIFAGATTSLSWGAPGDADVVGYLLYRGTTSSFTPGPSSLVGSPPGTTFVDPAAAPYWYKVAAVDAHGNIGPFATTLPAGALGTDGPSLPTRLELALAGSNPMRGAAGGFRLALPSGARVRLTVFDVGGRRVRELLDQSLPAGRHVVGWDGRDAAGNPAASGVYLVRLEAGGQALERRVARLR